MNSQQPSTQPRTQSRSRPSQSAIRHLPVSQQVMGAFDGGRITENKPIGFPQEFPKIKAIGPLLYWAWAKSREGGMIGLHPHRGFEIMSYCLAGSMVHRDSTGNQSTVSEGGIQVMQTGSGVSHEEGLSENGEFFQIWFHPDLEQTLREPAQYHEFSDADFSVDDLGGGVEIKRVLGPQGVMQLKADAVVEEVRLSAGSQWTPDRPAGWAVAAVAISGSATWTSSDWAGIEEQVTVEPGDLSVVEPDGAAVTLVAGNEDTRILAIQVPREVGYRLHG